jgi:hypothetical protein
MMNVLEITPSNGDELIMKKIKLHEKVIFFGSLSIAENQV